MNFPKFPKKLLFRTPLDKFLLAYTCSRPIYETKNKSLNMFKVKKQGTGKLSIYHAYLEQVVIKRSL